MTTNPTPADVERANQICLAIRNNKGLSDFNIIYSALAAERQACAEFALQQRVSSEDNSYDDGWNDACSAIASAIRAEFAREE